MSSELELKKTARQIIDDIINDDAESSKKNFHDYITAKTAARLNPEAARVETDDSSSDEDLEFDDDDGEDIDLEFDDDDDLSTDDETVDESVEYDNENQ